jgi:hypothetical protein
LNTDAGFQFDDSFFDNDFVILKLGSPLQFDDNVQPACLPSSPKYLDFETTKEKCFTSGWGKLQSSKMNIIL